MLKNFIKNRKALEMAIGSVVVIIIVLIVLIVVAGFFFGGFGEAGGGISQIGSGASGAVGGIGDMLGNALGIWGGGGACNSGTFACSNINDEDTCKALGSKGCSWDDTYGTCSSSGSSSCGGLSKDLCNKISDCTWTEE